MSTKRWPIHGSLASQTFFIVFWNTRLPRLLMRCGICRTGNIPSLLSDLLVSLRRLVDIGLSWKVLRFGLFGSLGMIPALIMFVGVKRRSSKLFGRIFATTGEVRGRKLSLEFSMILPLLGRLWLGLIPCGWDLPSALGGFEGLVGQELAHGYWLRCLALCCPGPVWVLALAVTGWARCTLPCLWSKIASLCAQKKKKKTNILYCMESSAILYKHT
jgi:hypothetical protein